MDKIPTFAAMLQCRMANTNILVFSKWSRKSYAIFASLHKVVTIARISIHICKASLLKNQVAVSLFNRFACKKEEDFDTIADSLSEDQQNLLLLIAATTNFDIAPEHRIIIKSNNESPYFVPYRIWAFLIKK